MKKYHKALKKYDPKALVQVKHEWGQDIVAVFNLVVEAWNAAAEGSYILISSSKKLGVKRLARFLNKHGVSAKIVGKGPVGLRLVECKKDTNKKLEKINTDSTASFTFNGKTYHVEVGDAIFSQAGLDEGTRFLLEEVVNKKKDFQGKRLADVGAGWGAISLVLAREFPAASILAYEKDKGSFEAARVNLEQCQNVRVFLADLAREDIQEVREYRGSVDYVVANPPFHITSEERDGIFGSINRLLKSGGKVLFVVEQSFEDRFQKTAESFFEFLGKKQKDAYIVCQYIKS